MELKEGSCWKHHYAYSSVKTFFDSELQENLEEVLFTLVSKDTKHMAKY